MKGGFTHIGSLEPVRYKKSQVKYNSNRGSKSMVHLSQMINISESKMGKCIKYLRILSYSYELPCPVQNKEERKKKKRRR